MRWYTYILKCRDGSFYTGITNNLAKRLDAHNSGEGAAYTRSRRPVRIVYVQRHSGKSSALKREFKIKSLRRDQKRDLISSSYVICRARSAVFA